MPLHVLDQFQRMAFCGEIHLSPCHSFSSESEREEEEPRLNPPLPCSVAPTVTTFAVSPALNHHQVLLSLISSLSPSIDVEQNCISVYNNVAGAPVEIHQEERVYVHLLTSSNYYDTVKKTTGGRNGYGPKLTNIFSTEFVIETTDVIY